MKKLYFILEDTITKNKISGHAYTLAGVRHIFKKVTNADKCEVYKHGSFYLGTPFITYRK